MDQERWHWGILRLWLKWRWMAGPLLYIAMGSGVLLYPVPVGPRWSGVFLAGYFIIRGFSVLMVNLWKELQGKL
ncbi:hypothetical protein JIR001_17440 [Polycladomyces abyssicola]|uniref:Uncharacterized protein n=1 Tax=Polycladomyces abyssicola TaxID=1125966 RepID=A0A8D5ZP25_9BACL|nr:hypothetical protein JIR001_17440 [Polycladomyces abyssicola]